MIDRRSSAEPSPLEVVCPYVRTEAGWRAASPVREHRCGAVEPPVPVSIEKQRRFCVSAEHETCTTYLAARAARAERDARIGGLPGSRGPRRPIARTAPLVLDRPGTPVATLVGAVERSRVGQAALVGTIALAAGAFLAARTGTPADPGTAANPTAIAGGIASPSPEPPTTAPTAAATVVPTPAPTAEPTTQVAPATGTPAPTPRTYTVRAGDTLVSIASRFGTTVKAIQDLNEIDDPRRLRVGQVLEIP